MKRIFNMLKRLFNNKTHEIIKKIEKEEEVEILDEEAFFDFFGDDF